MTTDREQELMRSLAHSVEKIRLLTEQVRMLNEQLSREVAARIETERKLREAREAIRLTPMTTADCTTFGMNYSQWKFLPAVQAALKERDNG
jgi:hypothetical protein